MPILCKVHRGDFIESIHVAYAVVVNGEGEIAVSYTHLTLPTTPYV